MSSKSSKHVAYKWDTKKTSELIQHLEMYPELWNCNLKEYRDRFKKDRALKIISETLQVSVPEINRKFHNLRCQMNSEIRKMNKRKKKSGDGATDDSMHTSQWEYFERLKFLIGIYKSTKSIGTSVRRRFLITIYLVLNMYVYIHI